MCLAIYSGCAPSFSPDANNQQPRQLQSIFTVVETKATTIDGKVISARAPAAAYWPLKRWTAQEDAVFPETALPIEVVWQAYETLWLEFCSDATRLKQVHDTDSNPDMYLESLQLLLQRYTWCMPSAYYKSAPDVSLFDHSRMTGALAAVLCERDKAVLTELGRVQLHQSGEDVALLVSGDLSGVQDFIYTITSRAATPGLRGRSFYLQLLTEAAVRLILRRLELPVTNLIYAGGGNFYLLARPADVDRLRHVHREISTALKRHHKGALYLAIAHQKLHARDFFFDKETHGISGVWEKLGQSLARAKLQRFSELGEGIVDIFAPQGDGGNEDKLCQVCGLEHPDTEARDKTETNPDGVRKCPVCLSYEELGDRLRRARYLVLDSFEPKHSNQEMGACEEALAELGMGFSLSQEARHEPPPRSESSQIVLALDDLDDDIALQVQPLASRATGRRMFVNVTPLITPREIAEWRRRGIPDLPEDIQGGSVKPFGIMTAESEGIKRLGVLRMDVDNLGDLFAHGLGNRATLSRVASLSAAVSLFFEGWVGTLAREVDNERNRLYSIYSGGDDLFFVGSWNVVMTLAQRIRADLGRFAAGHPGIHVSGGLVLVGAKYPLSQAASDGHHAEQQAKALEHCADGMRRRKDALTFLGKPLPWHRVGYLDAADFGTATGVYAFLRQLVTSSDNNAIIGKLAEQYAQYAEAERARREKGVDLDARGRVKALYGPWHWRLAYLLSQQERRTSDRDEKAQIGRLREAIQKDGYRSMEWLGLAARWAQYSLRE